jgi:flagellar P-ring protein precursor FlgI
MLANKIAKIFTVIFILNLLFSPSECFAQAAVRIKDISTFSGNREYQIIGYGLVTGLNGTGDKSDMSLEMIRGMFRNLGMELSESQIASKNSAAVIVTTMLPGFARPGEAIDITISSIGDAKSLQGGVLLPTMLKANDGNVYAVAQGAVSIGGFESGSSSTKGAQKNHLTVGYISKGATVERGVDDRFAQSGKFTILLQEKDLLLSRKVKEVIDNKYGAGWANITNPGQIEVTVPRGLSDDPVSFAANIEKLTLTIDEPNKVVINERTGTVVVGNNVRISRIAISHNGIKVAVSDNAAPTRDAVKGSLVTMEGETTVDDLVNALNAVGATPKDLIAIFQALNVAGALHGELKTM